jgi:hypothetical protein
MSTLKTNTIDTSTGTTITIPTGRVLTVTDNSGISIAGTAVSATAAQLNVMATVTASATEINVLDGIPAGLTATELGYSDGVTSAIQTQMNTKGTGDASLDTAQNWTKGQRGEITALTDGATITIDMADSNNFSVTLGGNRTFANPSNDTAGQSGSIFITQDGTGSRTASWGTDWEWAAGTAPVLTTTAAASDRIDYVIRSGTSIQAVATLALA